MGDKMATLSDCRIVDLKRSKLNKESDPKKHKWVFDEKRYVNRTTFTEDDVWFSWEHYNPKDGCLAFEGAKLNGWSPVIVNDDQYIVEGAHVNGDGYWTFKDAVLMRCRFADEVARREKNIKATQGGGKKVMQAFAREVDQIEPAFTKGAGMGPDEVEQLMGHRYKR